MRSSGWSARSPIETAKTGVTVNAVCPGYTDTDLMRDSVSAHLGKTGSSHDEARARHISRTCRWARLIKPEEVAAAVVYLCSPDAAAVTGTAHGGRRWRDLMIDDRRRYRSTPRPRCRSGPHDHEAELRLWLRLLTCTTLIENEIRRRLRDRVRHHAAALRPDGAARPRAERHDARRVVAAHDGLERQRHRSRRAAGCAEGLVERRPAPNDRRVQIVTSDAGRPARLPTHGPRRTKTGSRRFSPGLRPAEIDTLMPVLAKTKASAAQGDRCRSRPMSRTANPVRCRLRLQGAARALRGRRQGRDADARSAGARRTR